jgi:hypothetical protein
MVIGIIHSCMNKEQELHKKRVPVVAYQSSFYCLYF